MVVDRRDVIDRFVVPLFSLFLLFPVTMVHVIVGTPRDGRSCRGATGLAVHARPRRDPFIQLALIVAVTIAATSLLSGGAGNVRVAVVVAGLAAVVAIGGRFADRLRDWVDRRFFREAYDAERVLTELSETCGRWWRRGRCCRPFWPGFPRRSTSR